MKNNKKKKLVVLKMSNLKNSYCGTIPPHFEICPSSSKLLGSLCSVNNIFISRFVKLESQFLLQEKLYLCEKQDKDQTLINMKDIHNKMRYFLSQDQLSYHQTHLNVVKFTNVSGGVITQLDTSIKNMPSLKMNINEMCKDLDTCNNYIPTLR